MSIKALPSMEHTFTVSEKGSNTGQVFDGTFSYKRPNIRTQSDIARTAALLDGGMRNLDEDTKTIHHILATLKHSLFKFPEWWKKSDGGYDLYDFNIVSEIYKECMKFENDWFEKVWGEKESKPEKKKPAKKQLTG